MPSNRNSAGADIDPGVVKQAANGTQRGGFLPGLPSGTVTGGTKQPISAQASLGWPLQATAAQPTQGKRWACIWRLYIPKAVRATRWAPREIQRAAGTPTREGMECRWRSWSKSRS